MSGYQLPRDRSRWAVVVHPSAKLQFTVALGPVAPIVGRFLESKELRPEDLPDAVVVRPTAGTKNLSIGLRPGYEREGLAWLAALLAEMPVADISTDQADRIALMQAEAERALDDFLADES